MFAETAEEKACAKALISLSYYITQVATDPSMSIDDKMKMLQWVRQKIPEINRLLVKIKTGRINT